MAKIIQKQLQSKDARAKLAPRGRPYCVTVAPGVRLGFRLLNKDTVAGTWVLARGRGAGKTTFDRIATAEDKLQDKNGNDILDFWQAVERAQTLARGASGVIDEAARPVTVERAADAYERDLIRRKGNVANANNLRYHLQSLPALRTKLVALLTQHDVKAFIDHLLAAKPGNRKIADATVNRITRIFKAALNVAARENPEQIKNAAAWRGVQVIADAEESRHIVITEAQVAAVVAEAYALSERYGAWTWTLAETGTRHSQARALRVRDLNVVNADRPYLNMPGSRKGKAKKATSAQVQITRELAAELAASAAGRAPHEPLLLDDEGNSPSEAGHFDRRTFTAIAVKLGLPRSEPTDQHPEGSIASAYCLRHTSIVRALKAGVQPALVAKTHNTSIGQIEKTYAKRLDQHGADAMRVALPSLRARPAGNVVALKRTAA